MNRNPFNPTFGDVPELFLKSDKANEVNTIIKMITNSNFARSIFITGVRGVGKTSLMMRVTEKLNSNKDFYIVDLINQDGMALSLFRVLNDQVNSKLKQTLDSISEISIAGVEITRKIDAPDINIALDKLMQGIKKEGKKVVITIDEVTDSKPIRDFVQVFNALKRKKYPVYVVMTGLPDLVLDLQNSKNLTFLLRSDKIIVSPLGRMDIFTTYQRVFKCSNDLATKMTDMTKGYSYAFQLLGYLLFEHVDGKVPTMDDLDQVTDTYKKYLYNNSYQKIFSELSEMDRKYLYAVCGNHKLDEIAKILGKSNVFVAQYRRRAIERNLVVPVKMGYVAFTLPYFKDYLAETKNENSLFYMGY